MFTSLAAVVLCLQPGAAAQESVPKGVWAFPCAVVAVRPDALEVIADLDRGPDRKLTLTVTKDTKLEVVDVRVTDGKVELNTTSITLKDLHQDQPISVVFFSDGKELKLLRGVATGPKLSGKDLAIQVEKLGGKVTRLPFVKDRVAYKVDLSKTKVTDADLLILGEMKGLDDLDLSRTRVTDRGIAALAGAEGLSGLDLVGTKVTDAAIPHLRKIPKLSHVNLAQTDVTARGVAQLVEGKTMQVCWRALGDKAQYRVFERYEKGEREYNYLMVADTHYGLYMDGKVPHPPGAKAVDRRREATTYYHRNGPVGQVMAKLEWFRPAGVLDYPSDVRLPATLVGQLVRSAPLSLGALVAVNTEPAIGVVRVNVGTHAAYLRPYQHIDFYNSTPEIASFSVSEEGKPAAFGYIQDAQKRGAAVRVIDGAERTSLARKSPKKYYSALFIDVTRTDLRDINTDLLTKEALADAMSTLKETGVVCFHTSHRYHDLPPAIIDAAKSLNLAWKVGRDMGPDYQQGPRTHFGSEWVVVARKAEYLAHLTDVKGGDRFSGLTWSVPESTGKHLWRDGQPHDLKALARPAFK
jgi:hypothetical protein